LSHIDNSRLHGPDKAANFLGHSTVYICNSMKPAIWSLNGKPPNNSNLYRVNDYTIQIISIQLNNRGTYECEGTYDAKGNTFFATSELNVIGRLVTIMFKKNIKKKGFSVVRKSTKKSKV